MNVETSDILLLAAIGLGVWYFTQKKPGTTTGTGDAALRDAVGSTGAETRPSTEQTVRRVAGGVTEIIVGIADAVG